MTIEHAEPMTEPLNVSDDEPDVVNSLEGSMPLGDTLALILLGIASLPAALWWRLRGRDTNAAPLFGGLFGCWLWMAILTGLVLIAMGAGTYFRG